MEFNQRAASPPGMHAAVELPIGDTGTLALTMGSYSRPQTTPQHQR